MINLLEPLTRIAFTIKDCFSFSKEITKYDSLLYMASLNVESLFANIPLNKAINNCASDLHNKNLCNGNLTKADLFKLLETVTSASSFILDYVLHKQVDGVTMGSVLGPILANAFLYNYENEWLNNCPNPLNL